MASPVPGIPPRSVWKTVGCVLAVVILLAAAWPVASRLLAGERLPASGALLEPGPGEAGAELRTRPAAWSPVSPAAGPEHRYVRSHRGPDLTASFVDVGDPADVPRLWSGLRKVLPVSGASSRPEPAQGLPSPKTPAPIAAETPAGTAPRTAA
ncbi:hypothetical protein [Streptomyces sp. CA-111067]|uniref:hypothetical protein n=1 Tax=Streptomyces sp. CA-111067 TaxID=3240046 RepID=UPI003D99CCC5